MGGFPVKFSEADPQPPFETRTRARGMTEVRCPACGAWRPDYCVVDLGSGWECDGDISKRNRG